MASLQSRLSSLITAIGTDIKALQTPKTLAVALPGTPVDGEETFQLVDSGGNYGGPFIWRFRYRAFDSKWYFIGGGSLFKEIDTNESRAAQALTWADIATVGPSLVIPVTALYLVEWGVNINWAANYAANSSAAALINNGGTQDGQTNITGGTGPAGGAGNTQQTTISGARQMTLTATNTVKLQYNATNSAASFRWRWLKATPIRT